MPFKIKYHIFSFIKYLFSIHETKKFLFIYVYIKQKTNVKILKTILTVIKNSTTKYKYLYGQKQNRQHLKCFEYFFF